MVVVLDGHVLGPDFTMTPSAELASRDTAQRLFESHWPSPRSPLTHLQEFPLTSFGNAHFRNHAPGQPLGLRVLVRSTVATAAMMAVAGANAQSASPAAAAASAAGSDSTAAAKGERQNGVQLQTVEVTSNKRRQLQSDVAGSIASVQGSQLEALGARDMEDTLKLTPGVQFDKGTSDNAVLSIRGVATTTEVQSLQQGTTGLYIEDVPFTDGFSQLVFPDVAPFDLSRVEVLKGPQGALYGSSSMGGAIRYLVNRPTKDLEGSVLTNLEKVSQGGVGGSAYGMINTPINDTVAMRAVVFRRHDAGYIDNVAIGRKDSNDLNQSGGRLLMGVRPSKDLDIQLMAMTQQTKVGDTNAVAPDPAQLTTNRQIPSKNKSEWSLFNALVNYDLGGFRLTSNTGYQEKSRHDDGDETVRFGATSVLADPSLPPFPFVKYTNLGKVTSTSQEFRITPTSTSAFSYVAGVFWQKSKYENDQLWDIPGGAQFIGAGGEALLPNDRLISQKVGARTTETAIFFDGELAFSPAWTVGLGARKYWTKFSYVDNVGAPLLGLPESSFNPSTSDSGLSPKLSVKYKFSPQAQWYALRSQGYRFGGVNDIPPSVYKSDKLINYETGIRINPTADVSAALAVYHLDWKDAQVTAKNPVLNDAVVIQNVGKAKIDGAELTVGWSPVTAIQLDASFAYANARTVEPLVAVVTYPAGTRLPGTSRRQATVQGTYRFALADGSARLSLLVASIGNRYADLENQIKLPGYTTADARFTFSRNAWEYTVYANNLTDERGQVSATTVGDTYLVRPRTLGLSARYDF